jgi:hypothetical protein
VVVGGEISGSGTIYAERAATRSGHGRPPASVASQRMSPSAALLGWRCRAKRESGQEGEEEIRTESLTGQSWA